MKSIHELYKSYYKIYESLENPVDQVDFMLLVEKLPESMSAGIVDKEGFADIYSKMTQEKDEGEISSLEFFRVTDSDGG